MFSWFIFLCEKETFLFKNIYLHCLIIKTIHFHFRTKNTKTQPICNLLQEQHNRGISFSPYFRIRQYVELSHSTHTWPTWSISKNKLLEVRNLDFGIFMLHILYKTICSPCICLEIYIKGRGASLVTHTVKNLPAVQEIWVWSLSQEDSLEKEMGTHPSSLGWRIPWTEEPGGLQSMGLQRNGHDWLTLSFQLSYFYTNICLYIYTHSCICLYVQGFPGSSANKESAAMQETLVGFLDQENPLEKG